MKDFLRLTNHPNRLFTLIILLLFARLPFTINAHAVNLKQLQEINEQAQPSAKAQAIAVDEDGNSYVTGSSSESESRSHIRTIKYSPSGEKLWEAVLETDIPGEASADIMFSGGSVFVLANVAGQPFLARYAADNGAEVWVKQYERNAGEGVTLQALSADNAGGIYVTGYSYTGTSAGGDYLTARYDVSTGNKVWEQRYDNDHNSDQASAITVGDGGVFVTGSSWGPGTTIQYATIRYNAATGAQIWVSRYSGSNIGYSRATDIAMDNSGGVYVTGTVQLFEGFPTDFDYGTVRYDAATGTQTWASLYHINGYFNRATSIAVDNNGGVYVTGHSNQFSFDASNADYATVKYSTTTGAQVWVARYNGPADADDQAVAIAVDNANGVYVTGFSRGEESSFDYATIRYNTADGAQTWLSRYNGNANGIDQANDLAITSSGNVVVTGWSQQTQVIPSDAYTTISYEPATGDQLWIRIEVDEDACNIPVEVKLYLPPTAKRVGWQVRTTADFGSHILIEDSGVRWTWGDGSAPSVSYTAPGTSRITGEHTYQQAGIYQVGLDFTESCLNPENTDYEQWMPIYDPEAGFVIGAGQATGIRFNLVVRYSHRNHTEPRGNMQFDIDGFGRFRNSSLEWLVIAGDKATWKGEGTIDGKGQYGFIATVLDAGNPRVDDTGDRLRVQIWDKSRSNHIVFDNGTGQVLNMANQGPFILRGNIVIHRRGNISLAAKSNNKVIPDANSAYLQAYPNSFSEHTIISFVLEQEQHYKLEVYDTKGRLVRQLGAGKAKAGNTYEYELSGMELKEGLYFARLIADTGQQSIKVLLKR